MANFALSLAFIISFLFSPGGRILSLFFDSAVLRSFPTYQGHLLLAFANYWIPAVLIYFLLRKLQAYGWLRFTSGIHTLFGLGNTLLIFYVAVRIFASSIQGGGPSYAVMLFAPYVIWPAWIFIVIGLGRLLVRSIKQYNKPLEITQKQKLGVWGISAILVFVCLPSIAVAYTYFLAEDAPFRLARESKAIFNDLCKDAGQKIIRTPEHVESLYLEHNWHAYYRGIRDGVYRGSGGGTLGDPFINLGYLLYYEEKNDRPQYYGDSPYLKHIPTKRKPIPASKISSAYGVFSNRLVSDADYKKYGVDGYEIFIKEMSTDQEIARLKYFTSKRNRMVCGVGEDSNFDVQDFITSTLNLAKKRFPGYVKEEESGN